MCLVQRQGACDSTGVNGQHGSVSGISHDRKEGCRKGETTQQEGARLEDLYSGGHVRCTGMCESRACARVRLGFCISISGAGSESKEGGGYLREVGERRLRRAKHFVEARVSKMDPRGGGDLRDPALGLGCHDLTESST